MVGAFSLIRVDFKTYISISGIFYALAMKHYTELRSRGSNYRTRTTNKYIDFFCPPHFLSLTLAVRIGIIQYSFIM